MGKREKVATGAFERGYLKVYVKGKVMATVEGPSDIYSNAVKTAAATLDLGLEL